MAMGVNFASTIFSVTDPHITQEAQIRTPDTRIPQTRLG